jgi:hypothetical protein
MACALVGALPALSLAAQRPDPRRWMTGSSFDKCTLTALARSAEGEGGATVEIGWSRDGGYTAELSLWPAAPNSPWVVQTSVAKRRVIEGGAKTRFVLSRIETGDEIVKDLREGQALDVIVGTGAHSRLFSTGTAGLTQSVVVFNNCIPEIRDAASRPEPPARWNTGTSTGRACEMVATVDGLPGLLLRFGAGAKGRGFNVYADSRHQKDGGSLRIELPGGAPPWLIDVEAAVSSQDPRSETLLAELRRLVSLPLVFTPPGGSPVKLRTPLEGLPTASAMFDACAGAMSQPDLPVQPMFTELRYAVAEHDGICELTGTFQLRGNGMWLVLQSDGVKHAFKVTRRTLKPGDPIVSLDVSGFGGPKRLEAQDASYDLDADAFKALLDDMVGEGTRFGGRLGGGEIFSTTFGGKYAVVEGPMFQACARVKLVGKP